MNEELAERLRNLPPHELSQMLREQAEALPRLQEGDRPSMVVTAVMSQAADLLATMTADSPTLTIRAVRCSNGAHHPSGRSPIAYDVLVGKHCPTCHARGPEPGFVWPEWALQRGAISTSSTLNALYAAQSRIG